ncbi:MAG: hypothetical protein K2K92_05875, partial [Duncaniella sp.]|nr:hypothetical protein [Duncaniella sp.]
TTLINTRLYAGSVRCVKEPAVPFKQPKGIEKAGASSDAEQGSFKYYKDMYEVTEESMFHIGGSTNSADHIACDPAMHEFTTLTDVTINKDSPDDAAVFSYYTLENINVPNYFAKRVNGDPVYMNGALNYPSGVKSEDYQRWKSTLAYDYRASALVLKGEFKTHQELTYKAQFTVYLGNDPVSDFQVKRNHKYDNNIHIKGLDYVRNSSDNVYNFDGRVNVVNENPLYLSIVNERLVDAHATALPMDIWLTENADGSEVSEVRLRVEDPVEDHWIRMEYIPSSTMAAGRVINGERVPYAPGTGVRDYFTYDLVTNTLADNDMLTIPGGEEGNRSRVYFYIDENVPASDNGTYSDGSPYGPRSATIIVDYDVKYDDGTVETRSRTLDIDQAALLKVEGTHSSGYNVPTTWMEYYEEYLDHSDPLDRHEQPGELYTGLHWGLDGVEVNHNNYDGEGSNRGPHQIYYKNNAFLMTQWVFQDGRSESISNVKIFNDTAPASAFHYCYGKNKRELVGGEVHLEGSKGWYMPGIRELELALTTYYQDFKDEFQGNLYWSCAPHTTIRTIFNNQQDSGFHYARATGVNSNNTYVSSNTLAQGGSVRRTGEGSYLRIRAFYRVTQ